MVIRYFFFIDLFIYYLRRLLLRNALVILCAECAFI